MTGSRSALAGWDFADSVAGPYDPPWRRAHIDGTTWESEPAPMPGATGLILSWNARTPAGAGLAIAVSARIAGAWSPWTPMGEWGEVAPPAAVESPIRRKIDVAEWDSIADAVRARVALSPDVGGRLPEIRRIVLACDVAPSNAPDAGPPSARPYARPLPFRSQMVESPEIAKRICGPTSLAMHLALEEPGVATAEIAAAAYDARHDIYGNWARLAALAGEHGFAAWIERFGRLAEVERRLRAGYGAILSVAWEAGELADAAIPRSGGHLIALRGWTADGSPIANDPAFPNSRGDGVVYRRAELERAWADHGGATILLRPDRD